ncbi:Gfo/Idh/MocA family oxidoreductase [Brevibacillus choshinensis]|uniref:Gfo/Idh/MocA family protein n=1 Tax=Brevibacillus choshinensis TaxID=54911 RepID=UPI002E1FAB87|nr:Gfo/Idh/MocA family oxidoreductase [Brevibacillus choshinensis]MED4752036.1 Gfo/Idh/MocA family oxidoreductase [Brevibacillus choshinensis]MED4784467.1 Gfo/Idh/MocA family oxidoreductase [Brevibacillus choshinensis]
MRFGIIGTNWITEEFIRSGKEVEGFSLTAVYSRTEERARSFAQTHGAPNVFTDVETMAKSKVLDAVYIASPNSFHAKQAIQCMEHGLHVLCEKPVASNAAEAKAMIQAAKQNGVLLMEAVKSTLAPNFQAIQDNIHKLGKIRRYFAGNCQYSSRYDAYKEGTVLNAFDPVFSNGAMMDIGIYCLYPLVVLFGKPSAVKAEAIMLDSGVDGEGSILMKYEDIEAVVIYSKITDSYLPAEIQGEKATMVIDKINHLKKIEIRHRDGRVEDVTRPQTPKLMHYEIREFMELVKRGALESATNTHANSLITLEIMDEARKQIGLVYPADRLGADL